MKKYNIKNFIRYKNDVLSSQPVEKQWDCYTREELIAKFLPLVENLSRKFSTSQQASGVMTVQDLIQEGSLGLISAVDKIDIDQINKSEDSVRTIKSFLSKRIKGAIKRAINIKRGDIKIPEYVLNEMRTTKNEKKVAMFFNSIFTRIEASDDINYDQIEYKESKYNEAMFNVYLESLFKKHLSYEEYFIIKHSYGIDCEKLSAINIANHLGINVDSAQVRVSQIKREAINKLIENVDESQVIDFL